jgi:hypothetical protein
MLCTTAPQGEPERIRLVSGRRTDRVVGQRLGEHRGNGSSAVHDNRGAFCHKTARCLRARGNRRQIDLLLAIAAVLLLLLGASFFVLSGRRRGARGLLTSFGALAIVGGLALAPTVSPAPASAAASQTQPDLCVGQSGEDENADENDEGPEEPQVADVEATLVAPALSEVECGATPEVFIPEVEGIRYEQSRDGSTVTVTALALEGFALASGAASS